MTHKWLIGVGVVLALAAALALIAAGGQTSLAADGIIYVDADATGSNTGEDWTNAYTDLQLALADADAGDQIWVAEGTYKPTSGTDRTASFQMLNGVGIYGGFDPSAGDDTWEERDWQANPTILSGDIGIGGDAADNAYHVFYHPDGTNLDSSAVLDGFAITGGNADGDVSPHHTGGGMYNYASSPTLANLTFTGNSARLGGGIYNWPGSSPALTNCTFMDNSAVADGGGIYNGWYSSPALTNCTFRGNSADIYGGGMYNDASSPTLTNCTFAGNWVGWGGGGGIYNYGSSPVLTNCILWGDLPQEIFNYGTSNTPDVSYSDIQGGYTGEGNIDADPLFVDAASGDFHLGPGSPCIDAGSNEAPDLPGIDFEGDPRVYDGDGNGTATVDMGVDEHYIVHYVDADAGGANNGSTWDDAFTALQPALEASTAGDQIWVAEGTYAPTWQFDAGDPRSAAFQMDNGVLIYGGFDPSAGDDTWEERDWQANATILSGDIGAPDDPSDNSYHVLYHPDGTGLDGTAVLDGFTITGGNADGDPSPHWDGGGMYNDGSSPTLANLTFAGNSATWGGGLYNNDSSSPVLTNCTFSGNSAVAEGGGIFNSFSSPALTNCTFAGNSASSAGGMLNGWYSSPTLTNCILWGDTAGGLPSEISNSEDSAPVVSYSDIQGGCDADPYNVCGDGNIDGDPLFVDAANGNYHLVPGSPCIDTGYNAVVSSLLYDFEGDPRIMDGDRDGVPRVDMGVDEVFGYRVYLPLVLRAY